jgi:ribokinase
MMVKFDVVTFGSGVVDVFASTGVAEKKGRLDLEVGSKYLIDGLRVEVGGGGTNCAVAFARFGLKTGCICKVGEDANGIEVLTALRSEKVKFLGKVGEGNTGYSMIVDSKKKNRTILTFKGASNDVSLIDIKRFKSQWLYYSSLLGKSFVAQKKLARQFVAGGGRLAFNPSSYSIEKQDIRGLLRLCYVLVLNKEEAVELAKKYKGKGKNVLEKLGSLGPKVVVVTDKDKAVRCYDGVKMYKVVPHKGKRVVERTGAGDAFAAGFVAGMVRGHPIKECLDLGVMESEAVLAHYGAKNNLLKIKLK